MVAEQEAKKAEEERMAAAQDDSSGDEHCWDELKDDPVDEGLLVKQEADRALRAEIEDIDAVAAAEVARREDMRDEWSKTPFRGRRKSKQLSIGRRHQEPKTRNGLPGTHR